MGCREVMVVVGGRSVGDILELLHDGSDIGLSLTYRYQRGALGIAHAIGLAREFAGDDPIAIVLGDNILRGSLREFADEFVRRRRRRGRRAQGGPRPASGSAWPSSMPTGASSASRRSRRIRRAT